MSLGLVTWSGHMTDDVSMKVQMCMNVRIRRTKTMVFVYVFVCVFRPYTRFKDGGEFYALNSRESPNPKIWPQCLYLR